MTARTPHELALALLDEIDKDGSINTEYTADYSGKAPRLINVLQRELALHEGVQITSSITTLDDVLEISDDTAERIMPYGLAAEFARADRNENVRDTYSYKYNSLIRTIRMDEEDITDVYNVLDGL